MHKKIREFPAKNLTALDVDRETDSIKNVVYKALTARGYKGYSAVAECYGIIGIEHHEVVEAFHLADLEKIRAEVADLGAACLLVLSSLPKKEDDIKKT